jgi:uncharacterized membrane protein
MQARAQILGHPIHQMLVVVPVGLFVTAAVFDVIVMVTGNPTLALGAHLMIGAGIIGALLAAPFGTLDWLKIPQNTRAKRIGLYHASANGIALVLFLLSWWIRRDVPESPVLTAQLLALVGAAVIGVSGWLGGELIDRLGIGVHDDAHVDAPSSLSSTRSTSR